MKLVISLTLGLICLCVAVRCARILGVFPIGATSHYILGHSLMKGLAEAGHDVTVISPYEGKIGPSKGSYRNVILTGFAEKFEQFRKDSNLFNMDTSSFIARFIMQSMFLSVTEETFNNTNVKTLLNSKEKFDVVILEQFANDAMKIFAHHFNAPLILLSTIGPNSWVNYIAGNPSPPAYVPHLRANLPVNMTFFQRLSNLMSYVLDYVCDYTYTFPKNKEILKKYFPDSPDFFDLYHNASLILLNSHESFHQAVPLVPNMIPIGGYHVAPPKKLPKDLQDYLDGAKDGVIYFSMGSNLRSKDLPPEKRDAFLKIFSRLKEKVLWKWEDDVLPGQPPNVKLGKWLPQQDILAHPNVKLFITHGGLLSTTETVYHGVPILAIPVFGDQHSNAKNAVKNGFGLSLPYNDPNFSQQRLSQLLNDLLDNPKYRENVKRRSKIFHDRPLKPMENAIFWVEYVIRHRGAPDLMVAGRTMPLYQYLLLDVITFMVAITVSVLLLLRLGIRYLLCRKKHSVLKQKVKKS